MLVKSLDQIKIAVIQLSGQIKEKKKKKKIVGGVRDAFNVLHSFLYHHGGPVSRPQPRWQRAQGELETWLSS